MKPTITHPPIEWFNTHTPGQMAKELAKDLAPESGRIKVLTHRLKKGGISGARPRTDVFYFHDGIARKRRKSRECTRNGMCPHCKFLSVEQDIYLVTGPHPDSGKVTSAPGARKRAIIARFGHTYSCAKCMRDNGWRRVTDERHEVWSASWTGYCDEDNPNDWHHVEPLPVEFNEENGLELYVNIDTHWSKITIFKLKEDDPS